MKRLAFLFSIFAILFSVAALACGGGEVEEGQNPQPGDKTMSYCDAVNADVCGFIWFQNHVNTTTKAKFVVKMKTPDEQEVFIKSVELQMLMADGLAHSGPTPKIEQRLNNIFQITDTKFFMSGNWNILVVGETLGKEFRLIVPVFVVK